MCFMQAQNAQLSKILQNDKNINVLPVQTNDGKIELSNSVNNFTVTLILHKE